MRTLHLDTVTAQAYRGTFAPAALTPAAGSELPHGWEGLLFPFDVPLADLRPDGSPARDGVLPDFDLPRRMYAGEHTVFHRPLRFGDEVEQRVIAGSIVQKEGRAGRLVFADVRREYRVGGALAIESVWHDVFLGAPDSSAPGAARPTTPSPPPAIMPGPDSPADWAEDAVLDARQLFRFSALTFNTHRVHYDRHWARTVEGLDDLLVQGPLTRILLLDAAIRHDPRAVAAYDFRAVAPSFVDRPFRFEGRNLASDTTSPDAGDPVTEVLAVHPAGGLLAKGNITWA